nr:hypothetical protein CFP56_16708 [Quercus suber]
MCTPSVPLKASGRPSIVYVKAVRRQKIRSTKLSFVLSTEHMFLSSSWAPYVPNMTCPSARSSTEDYLKDTLGADEVRITLCGRLQDLCHDHSLLHSCSTMPLGL